MKKAITACNVLGAGEYQQSVRDVLEFTGKTVGRTLGPCANTSIIEEMGPMVASKDGFHTVKRLLFSPSDTFATNVLAVIVKMSQRMVALVGDGSTSAIVAAWKFSEALNESALKNARPRALNGLVQETLEAICKTIETAAVRPTPEELPDVMYKTALVSSNGDAKFAEMIKQIYIETKNEAMFNLVKDDRSGSEQTTYEIINGYKANQYYMIDPVFHNVNKGFEGKNVNVICFDMALTQYHYNMIQTLAAIAHRSDEDPEYPNEVVIVAPSYDQHLLDKISRDTKEDIQLMNAKALRHLRIRYMRVLAVDAYQRNEFMDFCALAGSTPITAVDFNDMVDPLSGKEEFDEKRLTDAVGKVGYMKTYLGEYTIIKDFIRRNDQLFETTFQQVETVYNSLAVENVNSPYPSRDFINTRRRYRKLLCKMVDIIIGAPNEYERSLLYDAADDATKACESVASNGYNVGGNMAILFAIDDMIKASVDNAHTSILNVLKDTFYGVVREVFANKYTAEGYDTLDQSIKDEIDAIIDNCVVERTYYDLIEEKYTNDIVNSSRTDTEILRGALSISLTLLTANQYIMQIPTNNLSE